MSNNKTKLYIVNSSVLPEVFIKVCRAKELLQTGRARTVAEAVNMVELSRSAFYKYKDFIKPFRDIKRDQAVTVNLVMQDRPGALSSVLSIFADNKANILTINQSLPANGVAMVTVSFTGEDMIISYDDLKSRIEAQESVIRMELLAG